MTRAELKTIAAKYNMDFIRHYITNQGEGVYLESVDSVPELDELVERSYPGDELGPCFAQAEHAGDSVRYSIYCPHNWIDLWGWTDD
nr:MAG TPA: hypothetical protein [Caudoviricetes sp.]